MRLLYIAAMAFLKTKWHRTGWYLSTEDNPKGKQKSKATYQQRTTLKYNTNPKQPINRGLL